MARRLVVGPATGPGANHVPRLDGAIGDGGAPGRTSTTRPGAPSFARASPPLLLLLRGSAALFALALLSAWTQLPGLYGPSGLLPLRELFASVAVRASGAASATDAARQLRHAPGRIIAPAVAQLPSLLWLAPLLGGVALSTLLEVLVLAAALAAAVYAIRGRLFGRTAPAHCLFFIALLAVYATLVSAGGTFFHFQWDALLLEMGCISALAAAGPDAAVGHALARWLTFRLLFQSGIVKLASGCPTWWQLTALDWHYESQPLPTPASWYAHNLPAWINRLGVVGTFVIEIGLAPLFLAPHAELRRLAAAATTLLMALITITGNYGWFNVQTVVLCWSTGLGYGSAGSDASRRRRTRWLIVAVGAVAAAALSARFFDLRIDNAMELRARVQFTMRDLQRFLAVAVPTSVLIGAASVGLAALQPVYGALVQLRQHRLRALLGAVRAGVLAACVLAYFAATLVPYAREHDATTYARLPTLAHRAYERLAPYSLANAYGLFRRMTGVGGRPELIVEAAFARDRPTAWTELDFQFKPGNVSAAPRLTAPHQPRLDWQMWFASLGSIHHNGWLVMLCARLMQGVPEVRWLLAPRVDALIAKHQAPVAVRIRAFIYHYTKSRSSTAWWHREPQRPAGGAYLPEVSLQHAGLQEFLHQQLAYERSFRMLDTNVSWLGRALAGITDGARALAHALDGAGGARSGPLLCWAAALPMMAMMATQTHRRI